MKIKYLLFILFSLSYQVVLACPVCEQQQPEITQGLTHGAGPQSNFDWVIIAIITGITLLTLVFSLKYLLKPGEKNDDHIKQIILTQECYE